MFFYIHRLLSSLCFTPSHSWQGLPTAYYLLWALRGSRNHFGAFQSHLQGAIERFDSTEWNWPFASLPIVKAESFWNKILKSAPTIPGRPAALAPPPLLEAYRVWRGPPLAPPLALALQGQPTPCCFSLLQGTAILSPKLYPSSTPFQYIKGLEIPVSVIFVVVV